MADRDPALDEVPTESIEDAVQSGSLKRLIQAIRRDPTGPRIQEDVIAKARRLRAEAGIPHARD